MKITSHNFVFCALLVLISLLHGCQTLRIEKRVHSKGYALFWKNKQTNRPLLAKQSKSNTSANQDILAESNEATVLNFQDPTLVNRTIIDTFSISQELTTAKTSEITQAALPQKQDKQMLFTNKKRQKTNDFHHRSVSRTTDHKESSSLAPWLRISLICLLIAGLAVFCLGISGLSLYLYLEFNLLFWAFTSGAVLGYLFTFLGLWGIFTLINKNDLDGKSLRKKAALWALLGVILGVLWGCGLPLIGLTL